MNKNHYILMANYNQWMNIKIYNVCSNIPDADRKKDMGAFFKSIHGTLNHILYGDIAWINRFKDKPINLSLGQDIYSDFEELRNERVRLDVELIEWVSNLDSAWLETTFEFKSMVDGKTRSANAWVYVSHLFNHQTHHRGQVTTLIKQLDYDPGVTDIPWMPNIDNMKD